MKTPQFQLLRLIYASNCVLTENVFSQIWNSHFEGVSSELNKKIPTFFLEKLITHYKTFLMLTLKQIWPIESCSHSSVLVPLCCSLNSTPSNQLRTAISLNHLSAESELNRYLFKQDQLSPCSLTNQIKDSHCWNVLKD